MTTAGSIDTAAQPAARGYWRAELIETIRLALPIALTQLGQIAMMTSDLALIGRLGDRAVAAAALAHVVLFTLFMIGMGPVSAVAPLASQAYGARDPRMVRRALRVGLWAAVLLGVPLTALQLAGETLLIMAGQAPDAAALASTYLFGLAWSIIPGWWFIALRNFMGSLNRPEPALWITLIAIPANALIAYALIYGAFGLPRLEMLGAGLATTLVNLGMCAALAWIIITRRPFRKYHAFGRMWRIDWSLMRQLMIIGAPISGSFLLEYGMFAAAALIMGVIGTTPLAAHQIALQIAAVMFMVPFGISMAATVRVGHAVGRGDATETRRAGFAAIALGAGFMVMMTLLVALTREWLPLLFLGRDAPGSAETIRLAAILLALGATFFIADGVQTIAAGALRGLNDTRVPMLFAAFSFWAVGFTLSYGLGLPLGLGAQGVWIGFTVGLIIYAVLLVWRFHALTQRRYLPALASAE